MFIHHKIQMKKSKLTFKDFRGLDFKTTQEASSFTWKANDVGFEEAYALIKKWVYHPLPDYDDIGNSSGRLFLVWEDLLLMETDGVKKWNWSTFVSYISETFNNSPQEWDIKPFFEVDAPGVDPGTIEEVGDQRIRFSTPLVMNKYTGKHLGIQSATELQTLYITGNTSDTIYLDWLIDGDIIDSWIIAQYVFPKQPVLVIYDWTEVFRFVEATGAALWTVKNMANWFIEVFANRLFVMSDKRVEFSTFNSATLQNENNYIDTDWVIQDKQIIGNSLVVFTTKGTYAVTGTWYTSMNFPKISEFAPQGKVFPVSHVDKTYVSHEGKIRRFTTTQWLLQTQYNYALIPDEQKEIFSIDRGVIFSLGHWSNKYWILNIEELENRRLVTITNFWDENISDIVEYKWTIFMISGGNIYKEDWYIPIRVKTNLIRSNKKMYRDAVEMAVSWPFPASIEITTESGTQTKNQNNLANQTSYNIKNRTYDVQVEIETNDPISSFNIYYMY